MFVIQFADKWEAQSWNNFICFVWNLKGKNKISRFISSSPSSSLFPAISKCHQLLRKFSFPQMSLRPLVRFPNPFAFHIHGSRGTWLEATFSKPKFLFKSSTQFIYLHMLQSTRAENQILYYSPLQYRIQLIITTIIIWGPSMLFWARPNCFGPPQFIVVAILAEAAQSPLETHFTTVRCNLQLALHHSIYSAIH